MVACANPLMRVHQFGGYDVILINMAIQDVPTLEPLVEALPKLLKKDGMLATLPSFAFSPPFFFMSDQCLLYCDYAPLTNKFPCPAPMTKDSSARSSTPCF